MRTLERIAEALEVIAAWASAQMPAPDIRLPLEVYPVYDWESIGARVIARDRHGATEVLWGGRLWKRYRSAEDDTKGIDIRFRRYVKEGRWDTLVKFERRTPPKPLRGELAELMESAQPPAQPAQLAQPAQPSRPPAQPAQPSRPPAQPAQPSRPPAQPTKPTGGGK